mmetsp:Transcript_42579/g.83947  ORF Transcript_42579/g.83947 Transcript_42579/m.83947 type:complete len:186 (-) Transcript_42579:274-831(-)
MFFSLLAGKGFSLFNLLNLFSCLTRETENLSITFNDELMVDFFLEGTDTQTRNWLSTETTKEGSRNMKVTKDWKTLRVFFLEWLKKQLPGNLKRKTDPRLTFKNYLKWVEQLKGKMESFLFTVSSSPAQKKGNSKGSRGGGVDPATMIGLDENTETARSTKPSKNVMRSARRKVRCLMQTYQNMT